MTDRALVVEAVQSFGDIKNTRSDKALHFNGASEQHLERVNRIGNDGEYTPGELAVIGKYAKKLIEHPTIKK